MLHAFGLHVAHHLFFLPSDYTVAHSLHAYSMQPMPNIWMNLGFSVIWHTCKLLTFFLCLQLTTLDTAQSIYKLYKHSLFQMLCGIFSVFMEDCQMREAAELERHRREWKINSLTSTRQRLSVLANVFLIASLLNYLWIWSNRLPAAMQNEDLIFFTVRLPSVVIWVCKIW